MSKTALKLTARLLPFLAAMMASVAIGASTPAPTGRPAAFQEGATRAAALQDAGPVGTRDAQGSGLPSALPIETPLIARADIATLASTYPVESLDTALTAPVRTEGHDGASPLFRLPRPDRWASLFATLALVAFFFLRRIV